MDSTKPEKKCYDVDNKTFEEHLKSMNVKFNNLVKVTRELESAGKNGFLKMDITQEDGEVVTKKFTEANLRAAANEFSKEIMELKKFHAEAKKKKKKPRDNSQQENLTGTYTPLYTDEVLQKFLTTAKNSQSSGFGDVSPLRVGTKGYKPNLLVNHLKIAGDGYMVRNTLTLLCYIYLYVNNLQDENTKSIICADAHMNEVFGNLPAGHYTGFYYFDHENKKQPFQKDHAYHLGKQIADIENKGQIAAKKEAHDKAQNDVAVAEERHQKVNSETTKTRLAAAKRRLEEATDVYNSLVERYNKLQADLEVALKECGRTEAIPKFHSFTQELGEEELKQFNHYKHAMTKLKGKERDNYIAKHDARDFSTFGITKNSYPDFDSSKMEIFMLQKIAGLNYETMSRLENDPEKFEKIHSEDCRKEMTEDHNLVQEVNNEWWDKIHIFSIPEAERKPNVEPRSAYGRKLLGLDPK